MKKSIIICFIFTNSISLSFGQSWSPGTSKLYANPTTTNIGIGTTVPNTRLHVNAANDQNPFRVQVNGSTKFFVSKLGGVTIGKFNDNPPAGGLYVKEKIGIDASAPVDLFQVGDDISRVCIGKAYGGANNGYGTGYIGFNAGRSNGVWYTRGDGANNGGAVIYSSVNGTIYFANLNSKGISSTTFTEEEITNSINFRICSNGITYAKEINVTLSGWPDYVFSKEYSLPDLNDLEAYVKENNHLPNVPSEKEVMENGVNIGQMNAILLQKIEELTLYLIEQQKTINELCDKVNMLTNEN